MQKILKKYTTIPTHLYVTRQADNQLRGIIEEMQRPGYVLVARQMGKTNLLINAKRTLEGKSRLFAYVDLSNLYQVERDCYRNIIDNILQPNIELFEATQLEVEKIRDRELPAHNEYLTSLLAILKQFKGDLVIILDEIDALKSVYYSDNIFAQIRSNYFSRTNYPVLERLTYVLSGVIEPTELIKDRNKSPFNIGDKIYLDDFSRPEFDDFVKKSHLSIDSRVSDEIYKWTNGNPRLTFDICSKLEDYLIEGTAVTSSLITQVVNSKYLKTFDLAPIDHIRELVKSNKDIRRAILSIHRKRYQDINDDTLKKLYLYGITGPNNNDEIKIKNRIIELSLSEEWLKSIERVTENNFIFALGKYSAREYDQAIETFISVLDASENHNEIDGCNYFLGMCFMKKGEFEEASRYFSCEFKRGKYRTDALAFLAFTKLALRHEDAMEKLEEAIATETHTDGYHTALLNFAINNTNKSLSKSLLQRLFQSTMLSKEEDTDELDLYRCLSHYYQAIIYLEENEFDTAATHFDLAMNYATDAHSLVLRFLKSTLLEIEDSTLSTVIVKTITENGIKFIKYERLPIAFNESMLVKFLDFVFDKNDSSNFESLLGYSTQNLLIDISNEEVILVVAERSPSKEVEILNYLLASYPNLSLENKVLTYRRLLIDQIKTSTSISRIFKNYKENFEVSDIVSVEDVYVFTVFIRYYVDNMKLLDALKLCNLISSKIESSNVDEVSREFVVILYWYCNIYHVINDPVKTIEFADRTLRAAEKELGNKLSLIDSKGLQAIAKQVGEMKFAAARNSQTIESSKTDRNKIVSVTRRDGTIERGKYKKFEKMILKGEYVIIK